MKFFKAFWKDLLLLSLIVAVIILGNTGCTTTGSFQGPDVCYGEDGALCADSLILKHVPDPAGASLLLQLDNAEALRRGAYSAKDALAVIDTVEGYLDAATTWATLCSYVIGVFDQANEMAGARVFIVSGYVAVLNQDVPVSACDVALLRAHLERQRSVIEAAR